MKRIITIVTICFLLIIGFCFGVPALISANITDSDTTLGDVPDNAINVQVTNITITDKSYKSYTGKIFYITEQGEGGSYTVSDKEYATISIGDEMQLTAYEQPIEYWDCFKTVSLVFLAIIFFACFLWKIFN